MNSTIASNSVELFTDGNQTKTRIKPIVTLSEVYSNSVPNGNIGECLDDLEEHVRLSVSKNGWAPPASSAFSNARGSWFELIVAATAWNYRIDRGVPEYHIVKMPNIKTYDFRSVYLSETQEMLDTLEMVLEQHNCVSQVSSNPDLLIINHKNIKSLVDSNYKISDLSIENIHNINLLYNNLQGKCPWDSVLAGIGLTTSLRPDRRNQFIHEGNIFKSLYAHLKMRYWNNTMNFQYHLASNVKHNQADEIAFRAATTHSIVNVNLIPERAVDGLHSLIKTDDIYAMFDNIIK
ncbi:Cfr10I/Bse634I family restriction endonuclease [Paenibacillus sp. 2TAB23]|uniref:Cfr10I/Bse634I family restriction endonuclease n=1 Tax=Paenibacillus sp. 2TAB23 TaxID=3233004 RepID=UPI003F9EACAD